MLFDPPFVQQRLVMIEVAHRCEGPMEHHQAPGRHRHGQHRSELYTPLAQAGSWSPGLCEELSFAVVRGPTPWAPLPLRGTPAGQRERSP